MGVTARWCRTAEREVDRKWKGKERSGGEVGRGGSVGVR